MATNELTPPLNQSDLGLCDLDQALRYANLWLAPLEHGLWYAGRPYGQEGEARLFGDIGVDRIPRLFGNMLHGGIGKTPKEAIAEALKIVG